MMLGPSNTAGRIDSAFMVVVAACVVLLAIVTVCMVVFLIRYNRKRHPRPEHVRESLLLEIVWTVVPTILVILMFYFGWVDFEYIRNPPKDAATVHVTARQWSWLFTYDNGKQSDLLRVPLGKPVKLVMTSLDVLHSLYIPAFRIKEDCVPGMKTHLWFTANKAGSYDLFCTEYCGAGHSHMRAKGDRPDSRGFSDLARHRGEHGAGRSGAEDCSRTRAVSAATPWTARRRSGPPSKVFSAAGKSWSRADRKKKSPSTRPSSGRTSSIPGRPPSRATPR